jgi:hypothetical protein
MDHAANNRTGSELTDYVMQRRPTEHQAPSTKHQTPARHQEQGTGGLTILTDQG